MITPIDKTEQHNAAVRMILPIMVEHVRSEADRWTVLESLCLGMGLLHGRTTRQTAIFIETMAERLAGGERD